MKIHNFNSGPAILPPIVIENTQKALINFNESNLSILEIGHRTEKFKQVVYDAQQLVKKIMEIGDNYEVLFLTGGATTQFMQIPLNFLDENETAAYIVNGIWGKKAAEEASLFGHIEIISNTADKNHTYIETDLKIPSNAKYVHITTNNTVEGTQWHDFPTFNIPVVADMSSDIFSKKINFNDFDLIYAGAQKNLGAAGVTLFVIKKSMLVKINRKIPSILDYQHHIKAGSILNTPPVISIFILFETLKWIQNEGGLNEMEKRNLIKANLLYQTIDDIPLYKTYIQKQHRSNMNVVFFIEDTNIEKIFLEECKMHGFVGVKGYRTMGGIRVSIYNALPLESVQIFCDFLKKFYSKFV